MSGVRISGFTLVELLVAMAILGLLMTAAFGSLRLGSKSLTAGVARADEVHDFRSSADFLRRQFAHLTPLIRQTGRERRIAFAGSPDAVRFIAPAPDASNGAGLVAVTVAIDRETDDAAVWLGIAPFDPGSEEWFGGTETRRVLFKENARDVEISYFGAPYEDDEPAWRREWRGDSLRFPEVVRLSADPDGDAGTWPEFRFPVHVGHWQ